MFLDLVSSKLVENFFCCFLLAGTSHVIWFCVQFCFWLLTTFCCGLSFSDSTKVFTSFLFFLGFFPSSLFVSQGECSLEALSLSLPSTSDAPLNCAIGPRFLFFTSPLLRGVSLPNLNGRCLNSLKSYVFFLGSPRSRRAAGLSSLNTDLRSTCGSLRVELEHLSESLPLVSRVFIFLAEDGSGFFLFFSRNRMMWSLILKPFNLVLPLFASFSWLLSFLKTRLPFLFFEVNKNR